VIAVPPPEAAEWNAVYGLLHNAADLIDDDADTTLSTVLLHDGAACECPMCELTGEQTIQWVAWQAAY
jgi:hypothetical protein